MEQEQTRQTGSEEAAPVHGAQGTRPRRTHTPRWALSVTVTLLCLALAAIVALGGLVWRLAAGVPASQPDAGGEKPVTMQLDDLPETADGGLTTAEIAQRVAPSVVSVHIYEQDSLAPSSMGSGVVLTQDGYIITNAHVVEGASGINVLFADGTEMDARIIGVDEKTDLAVIKVAGEGLVPAEFGDSGALAVGERAVAIGNAAGQFDGTVTQGVISGLDREVTVTVGGRDVTMSLIQTDAAINPGNSGGALVNRFGQVVGINSARMNSAFFEGICFAIPTRTAQPVVENLIAYGYVRDRGVLGVTVIALTGVNGPPNGLPAQGLYISEIAANSDLVRSDVTVGDIILEADGQVMETAADLSAVVQSHKLGETVHLKVQKYGSGSVIEVDAALVESLEEG
ncbi:MAG: trypsin-like peptidase domain-containing protein [Ruthenibacterium sp.]|nr:trypsin-like peptidase domain-containing protein [Ruthenibacterium sp.]HIV88493.1 trypsin-like peptidase domain-containing protein [Candidatus Ruthenibacterium merdipullorum]